MSDDILTFGQANESFDGEMESWRIVVARIKNGESVRLSKSMLRRVISEANSQPPGEYWDVVVCPDCIMVSKNGTCQTG